MYAVGDESISKAQLRLTDIAENLESDWARLAEQLGLTPDEITQIQREYHYVVEQVSITSHNLLTTDETFCFLGN